MTTPAQTDLDDGIWIDWPFGDEGIASVRVRVRGPGELMTHYYVWPLPVHPSFGRCFKVEKWLTSDGTDKDKREYQVSLGSPLSCTCWGWLRHQKPCRHIKACWKLLEGRSMDAPFQRHSETSREAAEKIEPAQSTLRGQVLRFLREKGKDGATDEEMQDALRMNPSTQRPRRVELVEAGFVVDSGRERQTRSGRQAVVWVATEFRELRQRELFE